MPKRDLFLKILNYEKFDRMPVIHWDGWKEFNEKLDAAGARPNDYAKFLNAESIGTPSFGIEGVAAGLFPPFNEEVIEQTDQYRIFRNFQGVLVKELKGQSSLLGNIEFLLKDCKGLPE